jgi:hypothetical protein
MACSPLMPLHCQLVLVLLPHILASMQPESRIVPYVRSNTGTTALVSELVRHSLETCWYIRRMNWERTTLDASNHANDLLRHPYEFRVFLPQLHRNSRTAERHVQEVEAIEGAKLSRALLSTCSTKTLISAPYATARERFANILNDCSFCSSRRGAARRSRD